MKTFTIQLNEQQLDIIGKLLGDAPFRVSASIVQTINQQIADQQVPSGLTPQPEQ